MLSADMLREQSVIGYDLADELLRSNKNTVAWGLKVPELYCTIERVGCIINNLTVRRVLYRYSKLIEMWRFGQSRHEEIPDKVSNRT